MTKNRRMVVAVFVLVLMLGAALTPIASATRAVNPCGTDYGSPS